MNKLSLSLLFASTVLTVVACDTEAESPLDLTVLDDRSFEGAHVGAAGEHLDFAITRTDGGPRASFELQGEPLFTIADGMLRVGDQEVSVTDVEQVGLMVAQLEQSSQGQALAELAMALEAELGDELPTSVDRLLAPTNDDPTELKAACYAYPIYDALNQGGACQFHCLSCAGCNSIWSSLDCFSTGAVCEWICFDY